MNKKQRQQWINDGLKVTKILDGMICQCDEGGNITITGHDAIELKDLFEKTADRLMARNTLLTREVCELKIELAKIKREL